MIQVAYLKVYKVQCTPNWNQSTCFVFMGFNFTSADPSQGLGCARSPRQTFLLLETESVFFLSQRHCICGSGRLSHPSDSRKKGWCPSFIIILLWTTFKGLDGRSWVFSVVLTGLQTHMVGQQCGRGGGRCSLWLFFWRFLGELLSTFAVSLLPPLGRTESSSTARGL